MLTLVLTLAGCEPQTEFKSLKPDIVVSPEVLDFGQVVEEYPSMVEAEVINAGQGILEIKGVEITGDGADAFTVAELPAEIPHDSSWPLQVTFTPEDPLLYTAVATITSNDPDTPDIAISLTGQGVVAPTPDIDCDPLALDFGTVAAGSFSTLWVTCTNVGDADLEIESWLQENSGAFQLVSDPTGAVLPPGMELPLIVMYNPTADWGDNGRITLTTNDPDEPQTVLTFVGNGGGDFEYPVAVVSGPATAEPRTTITVEGGDSYDPNGYEPLTYHWTVLGPYDDVVATESGTDVYLQLDLAGEYRVSLQVENTIGLLSAPAVYTVEAIPVEEFHVELIWDDLPDLDLHLLTSAGEFFVEPYDCNYCNPNPDWGTIGGADDPTLDLDALSSPPGLENINIEAPADDSYYVRVHYYAQNGGGDTTATVNIYLYGTLEASFDRVLQYDTVWDVARIVWPDGYVVEEETDLYDSPLRTCEAAP